MSKDPDRSISALRPLARSLALALGTACGAGSAGESASVGPEAPTEGTSEGSTDAGSEGSTDTDELLTGSCAPGEIDALYAKRIEPLLATERPKSCNQCHLAGIDLSSFVRETPCATFACMSEQGLIDRQAPSESLILDWIARATPSGLVSEEMIAEEAAGFLAWIEATASCDGCASIADPCGTADGPTPCGAEEPLGFDDPGGCEARTLEAVFRSSVYAWRDRCYPCHFTTKDNEAPSWIEVGECDLASLATMRNVLKAEVIDLEEPSQSRLLLKPLAEAAGGLVHGGHDKFESAQDPAYLDVLYWIERESECR